MNLKICNVFKSDLGKIFSGNIVVQITTILQTIIVSRILGPTGKGEFIEIILWPTIISGFSILGLYTGIVKLSANRRIDSKFNLVKTTLLATIIVGTVGSVISIFLSPILCEDKSTNIEQLLVIFSAFVLINNVARGFNAIDHGHQDFTRYSITRSILNPIYLLLLFILYLCKNVDLTTVVIALLIANLAVCIVRVSMGFSNQNYSNPPYPLKRLFKSSIKYSIADLSEPIFAYFDKAVLALVLLSYDLGIYTTAYSIASLINIISGVYRTKIFSDIASGRSISIVYPALRQNMILMIASGTILACCIPFFTPLVFGQDYNPSVLPAILLIFTCIVQGETDIIERSILALGYPFIGVKVKSICMVALLLFAFIFKFIGIIDIYSMVGIVTICQAAYFFFLLLQLKKLSKSKLELIPKFADIKTIINKIM